MDGMKKSGRGEGQGVYGGTRRERAESPCTVAAHTARPEGWTCAKCNLDPKRPPLLGMDEPRNEQEKPQ